MEIKMKDFKTYHLILPTIDQCLGVQLHKKVCSNSSVVVSTCTYNTDSNNQQPVVDFYRAKLQQQKKYKSIKITHYFLYKYKLIKGIKYI